MKKLRTKRTNHNAAFSKLARRDGSRLLIGLPTWLWHSGRKREEKAASRLNTAKRKTGREG